MSGGLSGPSLSVGKANISLDTCSADLLQTSDTAWTLAKTGVVDTANSTVTWTVTATKGATVGGHLVADGFLQVANSGSGPATIGNIVVNLQTKVAGKWVTQSSDIADATQGDAATTAHVVAAASSEGRTLFTENAASGHLSFTDRKGIMVFSLVPQVSIPARTSVSLLFSATFDNNVLHLATGTATRTEIIVTFGNHPAGGPNLTDTNVDINGNGIIDPDEAKVRSVSTRFQDSVPNTRAANSTVTITDALADITTGGTVTFSNPVFTLGATGGTVKVTYDSGASGGSITNCAHADGRGITDAVGTFQFPIVAAFHADACDTQQISAHTCTPGTPGCPWKDGDFFTYDQTDWDTGGLGQSTLEAHYNTVYASSSGTLEVGIPNGPPGFELTFSSYLTIEAYLPDTGPFAALDSSIADPTLTAAGAFGGEVVALRLNVDFSDAGFTQGTAGIPFGDLTLCNITLSPGSPSLNGVSVRDFLAIANVLLGGGSNGYALSDIAAITVLLDDAFGAGGVSTFAQQGHLVYGACP